MGYGGGVEACISAGAGVGGWGHGREDQRRGGGKSDCALACEKAGRWGQFLGTVPVLPEDET